MAVVVETKVLEQYEATVKANANVTEVDAALVELGRAAASAIDAVMRDPETSATERTKALYLMPHVQSVLREMLATPLARKQVGLAVADGKPASRLALLQKQAKKTEK